MTARYVHPATGNDSGGGGIGAPWKTLTYAVANATTGDTIELLANSSSIEANWQFTSATANNKVLSIYSTAGNTFTFTATDTTRAFLITGVGWANTSTFTISNINISSEGSLSNGVIESIGTGTGAVTFAFSNCSIGSGVFDSRCLYDNAGVSTLNRIFSYTNCIFYAGSLAGGTSMCDFQKPLDTLTFTSCTFYNGTGTCINAGQSSGAGGKGMNKVTLSNNTFSCTGMNAGKAAFFWNYSNTDGCGRMLITGNTVNTNRMAWDIEGAVSSLYVAQNTITGSNQNILQLIGADSNIGAVTAITYAMVWGNTLAFTGTVSHGHFMGRNLSKGEYCFNKCTGADYGMVIKGNTKIHAHHNICTNVKNGAIYVRGSQDSYIHNNSFYRIGAGGHGSENFGIQVDSIQDAGPTYIDPARNVFKENLIYIADGAPTSSVYGVVENTTSHAGVTSIADHVFDQNIMRLPSGMKWASFNGGTQYTALSDAQTAWLTYATVNKLNEANDQAADPRFYSSTDLRLAPDSPGLGTTYTLNNPYGGFAGVGSGGSVKMGISI